jgi:hypothetical protein
MIEETFDSRTLAKMKLALDLVCGTLVDGEAHSVRKRVARRIIKCAHGGKTSLDELTSAGKRAGARFARPVGGIVHPPAPQAATERRDL